MFNSDELNTPIQDFLNEQVTTSTVRITKKSKLSQQAGAVAIRLAKEANDPSYRLYKKYREMYLNAKKKIVTKYGRKAYREVRKNLTVKKPVKVL